MKIQSELESIRATMQKLFSKYIDGLDDKPSTIKDILTMNVLFENVRDLSERYRRLLQESKTPGLRVKSIDDLKEENKVKRDKQREALQ